MAELVRGPKLGRNGVLILSSRSHTLQRRLRDQHALPAVMHPVLRHAAMPHRPAAWTHGLERFQVALITGSGCLTQHARAGTADRERSPPGSVGGSAPMHPACI